MSGAAPIELKIKLEGDKIALDTNLPQPYNVDVMFNMLTSALRIVHAMTVQAAAAQQERQVKTLDEMGLRPDLRIAKS